MARLDAEAVSFCLMGNHYHLVLRTRQPNLSRLMRHVNGEYTRAFNRRHGVSGHLFQGRFHAVLVDCDVYLIQVCRYVELNPVRASLAATAADWAWSSYRAHVGMERGPIWLATQELHGQMLGRDAVSSEDRHHAANLYAATVATGLGVDLWGGNLRSEIFLGEEKFVAETQARATQQRLACAEINKAQRNNPSTLAGWMDADQAKQESFRQAYSEGGMTMAEISRQAGLSLSRVSRMIRCAEELQRSRPGRAMRKT